MDFDYQFNDTPYEYQDTPDYQFEDAQPSGGFDLGVEPNWSDLQLNDMWALEKPYVPEYNAGMNYGTEGAMSSAYEQPAAAPQWTPPSMGQAQAPQFGQMGSGPTGGPGGREEESWLSRLAKAGFGMGVGAGTTVLGSVAQNALAPKEKSSSPAAASQGVAATPTALPAAPTPLTYTPEALEPLPGTKASPLISGRPTTVKGSAGLKERRPQNGGFTLY